MSEKITATKDIKVRKADYKMCEEIKGRSTFKFLTQMKVGDFIYFIKPHKATYGTRNGSEEIMISATR